MAEKLDARAVFAGNLRKQMDAHPDLCTTLKLEAATAALGMKVGKSTIDRALKGQTPINLDYAQALAAVFGVPVSALLNDEPERDPIREAFEAELVKLPPGNQQTIRDAMKRDESMSWAMFRAGWKAGRADFLRECGEAAQRGFARGQGAS